MITVSIYFLAEQLKAQGTLLSNSSSHISRISNDSIFVISGNTYLFSVDTPEDQGLVSTTPKVTQLLSQLKTSGNQDSIYLQDIEGKLKSSGIITPTDQLIVEDRKGKKQKKYRKNGQKMARRYV